MPPSYFFLSGLNAFIAFAAKDVRVSGDVFNIYRVSLSTRRVEKLTNGTPQNGVECIDPCYHPDYNPNPNPPTPATPRRLAFAANAASGSASARSTKL